MLLALGESVLLMRDDDNENDDDDDDEDDEDERHLVVRFLNCQTFGGICAFK